MTSFGFNNFFVKISFAMPDCFSFLCIAGSKKKHKIFSVIRKKLNYKKKAFGGNDARFITSYQSDLNIQFDVYLTKCSDHLKFH